jgi:hypothetical protein
MIKYFLFICMFFLSCFTQSHAHISCEVLSCSKTVGNVAHNSIHLEKNFLPIASIETESKKDGLDGPLFEIEDDEDPTFSKKQFECKCSRYSSTIPSANTASYNVSLNNYNFYFLEAFATSSTSKYLLFQVFRI